MANRNKQKITSDSRTRLYYGISLEEVADMRRKQYGKCAICGRLFGTAKQIAHILITNIFRVGWALLCTICNTGLGCFKDNIENLQKAIDYVIDGAVPPEFNIAAARESQRRKRPHYSAEERKRRSQLAISLNTGRKWDESVKKKMSESAKRWQAARGQ